MNPRPVNPMPEPERPALHKFTSDQPPTSTADEAARKQARDRSLKELLRPLEGPQYGKVEQEIGKGGQGRVLCVEELWLKREVAKKVLPLKPSTNVDHERFVREARITARLEHPNIVPVYEIGKDSLDEPRLYYRFFAVFSGKRS